MHPEKKTCYTQEKNENTSLSRNNTSKNTVKNNFEVVREKKSFCLEFFIQKKIDFKNESEIKIFFRHTELKEYITPAKLHYSEC